MIRRMESDRFFLDQILEEELQNQNASTSDIVHDNAPVVCADNEEARKLRDDIADQMWRQFIEYKST